MMLLLRNRRPGPVKRICSAGTWALRSLSW